MLNLLSGEDYIMVLDCYLNGEKVIEMEYVETYESLLTQITIYSSKIRLYSSIGFIYLPFNKNEIKNLKGYDLTYDIQIFLNRIVIRKK